MSHEIAPPPHPLVGSIQNSVGSGFLGNAAAFAIANGLGARLVHASSTYASAHGGVAGRTSFRPEVAQFRRDVQFVIAQRPAVLIIGYLPRPDFVETVAIELGEYTGLVVVDPVMGDYTKGLYVSVETARAIKTELLPRAEIVTPNRFEAELLMGVPPGKASARELLDGLHEVGPETVVITGWERDAQERRAASVFSNGYHYHRIKTPYFVGMQTFGAGDTFASALGVTLAMNTSPLPATLFASTLASIAVSKATTYGGASVDPVAAINMLRPALDFTDERLTKIGERYGIIAEAIAATADGGARLRFAPPVNKITY